MTAFQLKEWWRYRRAAKGRHGVHSPFVYRLIEEGLKAPLSKELRQALRSAAATAHQYSGAKTLYRCQAFLNAESILLRGADAEETERLFSGNAERMQDGLYFIFADPHASPHNALQWLRLREDARVNLSIDLWHIGLLFFNKDFKERQHFVLKYPA